ncbi:acyltransferase [Bifidobacterium sp. LC6]|uniref:Acyltransferase n=1 Tax=Bifidobacterium colobi TaxID=2809026 RepID=A0ABS5UT92_9BIFI|nr:acyltransferase family protein [Bifidobacterium colobi]MBT1174194.1 acyltransferase [Bifidobacterium colobi]
MAFPSSEQHAGRVASSREHRDSESSKLSERYNPASNTPKHTKGRRHIGAIDGLRALAILGVVAYHTRPSLLQGGFLGVTIFFVISGFLITRSVTAEVSRTGTISYGTYLRKRVSRLVPPVVAIIALAALGSYLVSPSLLPKAQSDALPSLFFVSNWVYIFRHVSYFAAAGLPSPLTHLWFLGLLMQFYILWPIVLFVVCRRCTSRKVRAVVIGVLMVVSSLLMAVLFDPNATGSRAYYGLDTRAAELLAGALLAVLLPSGSDGDESARKPKRSPRAEVFGWVILVLLIVGFVAIRSDMTILYRGGYLIAALLIVALLAVAMNPASMVGRVLAIRPLRYLGSRSFSLYLVHYPLLEMMNPATRTTDLAWWEWIVQALVLWFATEAFYQLVEHAPRALAEAAQPVAMTRAQSRRQAKAASGPRAALERVRVVCRRVIVAVCAVATVLLCILPLDWNGIAQARSAQLRPVVAQTSTAKQQTKTDKKADTSDQSKSDSSDADAADQQDQQKDDGKLKPVAEKVPDNLDTSGWTYDASTGVCSADPLIITDSVAMGARGVLATTLPNAIQDNKVGRPITDFPSLYQQHLAAGDDRSVVIVALGANVASTSRPEAFEAAVAAVNGKPMYFITVRDPVIAQDWVNQNLRSVAANHSNVGVIDWHGVSEGHSEYFYDDGTHLTNGAGLGDEAYAKMVVGALCGQ